MSQSDNSEVFRSVQWSNFRRSGHGVSGGGRIFQSSRSGMEVRKGKHCEMHRDGNDGGFHVGDLANRGSSCLRRLAGLGSGRVWMRECGDGVWGPSEIFSGSEPVCFQASASGLARRIGPLAVCYSGHPLKKRPQLEMELKLEHQHLLACMDHHWAILTIKHQPCLC